MQSSAIPSGIQLPFANAGAKQTIPVPSQIGVANGRASYTDGFPPLTRTPVIAGGVPPFGTDMNGVLFAITAIQQWQTAGGSFRFDSAWSTANGGYPKGAILTNAQNDGFWISLVENNTTDPDAAANVAWAPNSAYGVTTIALTNANVTLTPDQYAQPFIVLTGTLTGNVALTLPKIVSTWGVLNNTTGAFSVTALTASGTPVTLSRGALVNLRGDTNNVINDALQVGAATRPQHVAQFGQMPGHGQCEFLLNGANLLLRPYNGNKLIINGVECTVPNAGVSLPPTGLTPGTRYLVYAIDADNDGVVDTLEASTTAHTRDATTGVEIKTGDPTRTLVGQVQPIAGPAFVDIITQRLVRDWFNRRRVLLQAAFSTSRSTSSMTPTELSSEIRNQYLAWEGEVALSCVYGTVTVSGIPGTLAAWGLAVDSASALLDASVSFQRDDANNIGSTSLTSFYPVSEGFHYTTLLGYMNSANTGAWAQSTFLKTVLGGSFL